MSPGHQATHSQRTRCPVGTSRRVFRCNSKCSSHESARRSALRLVSSFLPSASAASAPDPPIAASRRRVAPAFRLSFVPRFGHTQRPKPQARQKKFAMHRTTLVFLIPLLWPLPSWAAAEHHEAAEANADSQEMAHQAGISFQRFQVKADLSPSRTARTASASASARETAPRRCGSKRRSSKWFRPSC